MSDIAGRKLLIVIAGSTCTDWTDVETTQWVSCLVVFSKVPNLLAHQTRESDPSACSKNMSIVGMGTQLHPKVDHHRFTTKSKKTYHVIYSIV